MLNEEYKQILSMPEKQFTAFQLRKALEEIINEQQDEAMLGGLLVAELRLGIWHKHGIQEHSNRIHNVLFNMKGIKRKPFKHGGTFLYIYRKEPLIKLS